MTIHHRESLLPPSDRAPYLRLAYVAALLGVSVGTVRRWIREGRINVARPGGKRGALRVAASELEQFLVDATSRRDAAQTSGEFQV